jgi:hypothetical protein
MIENIKIADTTQRAIKTLHTAHKGILPQR